MKTRGACVVVILAMMEAVAAAGPNVTPRKVDAQPIRVLGVRPMPRTVDAQPIQVVGVRTVGPRKVEALPIRVLGIRTDAIRMTGDNTPARITPARIERSVDNTSRSEAGRGEGDTPTRASQPSRQTPARR